MAQGGACPGRATVALDRGGQARAVAGDSLGGLGPVPEGRVLDPGVQLIEFAKGRVPVKDAS